MALFDLLNKKEWNFPSNNYGQICGISDSGVENFKGTPMKSLAREICQNSLDARLNKEVPVKVEFKTFILKPSEIPGFQTLNDAFNRSLDYWSKQESTKAKKFFKEAIDLANKKSILCLRISDFNTTGLLGSDAEYNSPWCNLTKSQGTSDKNGATGGSFGIGKFAPYACSTFRTVFYSTLDKDGVSAYQGVSRLTSFKDSKGSTTQGTGFYGETRNTPVKAQLEIDGSYQKRSAGNSGTDIYVLGFNAKKDWKAELIASVLDGFLYAVYNNELIVEIEDEVVNKENIPILIEKYRDSFNEYVPEYYQVLTADDKQAPVYSTDIAGLGNVTLKMMIQPGFPRRVAMIRKTGMKIMDKGNISGIIPFAGIMFIEGEELNVFLRNLENPQHTKWEPDRADNVSEAKRVIGLMTKYIKECLDSLKNDDTEEAIDAAVGEFLAEEQRPEEIKDDPAENINDEIQNIEIKVKPTMKKPIINEPTENENEEVIETENIPVENEDGTGGKDGEEPNIMDDGTGGNGEGDGEGPNTPNEPIKVLREIPFSKTRVICANKLEGDYKVIIVPKLSAIDGTIDVFLSAETQNYDASILRAMHNGVVLGVNGNTVSGVEFVKDQPLELNLKVAFNDYCSMEVKAHGYKI